MVPFLGIHKEYFHLLMRSVISARNRELNSLIVDEHFQFGRRLVVCPADAVPGVRAPPPLYSFRDGERDIVPNIKNLFVLPLRSDQGFKSIAVRIGGLASPA